MNSRDQLLGVISIINVTCHVAIFRQATRGGYKQTWIPLTAKDPDTFLTVHFSVCRPASLRRLDVDHNRARAHLGRERDTSSPFAWPDLHDDGRRVRRSTSAITLGNVMRPERTSAIIWALLWQKSFRWKHGRTRRRCTLSSLPHRRDGCADGFTLIILKCHVYPGLTRLPR